MAYKMHLIGNAHLDPVWLWRWQEGYAEVKATFRSALDRMNEFPEFIFTCAGAAYYKWVEENAPEMFLEICRRVQEGRWVIVGGWWVQPDCNIPSGESFVRHGLYSQRYYLEKFGIMARVGYNVDSFGHNGMLPQILKKSGMDYYIFMRPGNHEKQLPGNLFWWESADGSRVMTFKIPYSYANYFGNNQGPELREVRKLRAEISLAEEQHIDFMFFYGVGNHGGGPTITNLNLIRKLQQEMDSVILEHSSPNAYFEEISKKNPVIPVVRDDLQHHASGCYSAHSDTKMNNRRVEHRMLTAEKFTSVAHRLVCLEYPGHMIKRAWENVMFNQFHDIMGGCSIKEAYRDAWEAYGEALHIGAEILNSAVQKISWSIDTSRNKGMGLSKEKDWVLWEENDEGAPLVVFNPLSWGISTPVQVNKTLTGVTDEAGNIVEAQAVRGPQTNKMDKWNTLFMGDIPAMGYRVYWIFRDKKFDMKQSPGMLMMDGTTMENDFTRLELESHTGYIKKLYDKRNGVNVLAGMGAVPIVIDDYENDTWAHGNFEFRKEIGKFSDATIDLIEEGPLRSRFRVTSRYNRSVLVQDFILYRSKPDIEVKVKLDWREKHKILKLSFPVNINAPKAMYEIPYGFMERPVNGEEEPGQQWLDVSGVIPESDLVYGLALLNDSKYSFDVRENDMRMTVVRSAIYADHFGERDDMCEFMDQGIQEFSYVLVPHAGSQVNAGIVRKAYELNVQPVHIMETYHKGTLPQTYEGIKISADSIVATVFKKAEDDSGYILRCYESVGSETEAYIGIPCLDRKWITKFGKYEIKTFFIPEDKQEGIMEKNLLEM